MKAPALLLALILAGCSAAGDPYAPRAGLWEVKGSFVTIEGPGMTPERIAELRRAMPSLAPSRECFDGRASRVGDLKEGGQCRITRVADAGAVADNEWQCEGRGGEGPVTSSIRGSRGPERYDYRITSSAIHGKDRQPTVIVMREQGRRIGDCPAKP